MLGGNRVVLRGATQSIFIVQSDRRSPATVWSFYFVSNGSKRGTQVCSCRDLSGSTLLRISEGSL